MLRYLVVRDFDNAEVLLLPQKDGSGWTYVNITKGHICPCKFKTIEEALIDCTSRNNVKQMIKLEG